MPWQNSSLVEQRYALIVALLRDEQSVSATCRQFGVSRQTGYKFLRRFMKQGPAGLRDQSRRPKLGATPVARRWRQRLLHWRGRYKCWGARKLRWLLRRRFGGRGLPTERTLQRWLAQAGLSRRRRVPRRQVRLELAAPRAAHQVNAVWTFDLKGWFRTRDGSKVEPLTVRDLWSRYVLWVRPLTPRTEAQVRRVCQRLFRRYGRPAVIRCDRGAPFFGDGPHGFTRLSLWWWRLGIRVEFVRRGAINNNAHEQLHGVLQKELTIAQSPRAQAQRLERWRRRYNEQRPHEGLGLRTPASRYHARPAKPPVLRQPSYPAHWVVRQVQRNGETCLPRWRGTIGRAFAGLRVGFAPIAPGRYRVYFAALLLGHLDLRHSTRLQLSFR